MNNKLTVTVGIPAYNEGLNIANILSSVIAQKGKSFTLEKIIVMIDSCTDDTEKKARAFAEKNKIIRVISDNQRKGKVKRLNQLYKINRSDILIQFDADIVLASQYVIQKMVKTFIEEKNTVMVSAHEVPLRPDTFIGKIIYAGYEFWDRTRLSVKNYDHIQNHYGAATALRKSFVKKVQYPKDITDDRGYLYLLAKKYGQFRYNINAVIFYRPVSTLHDFLKLHDRSFSKNQAALVKYFSPEVYSLYHIPLKNKLEAIAATFFKNPLYTTLALALNIYTRLVPRHDKFYLHGMWEISNSTKKAIIIDDNNSSFQIKPSFNFFLNKKFIFASSFLVITTILGNFLNLLFNIYIANSLTFENLGLVNLLSSFSYISTVSFAALGTTVSFRSGFLEGKYGKGQSYTYWQAIRKKSLIYAFIIICFWLLISPFLVSYFRVDNIYPFLIFTPILLAGLIGAIDKGFLAGKLLFTLFGLTILLEPVIKLFSAFLFIWLNLSQFIYISITLGIVGSFLLGWFYAVRQAPKKIILQQHEINYFPKKFFSASLISGISATSFLSIDIILAKHFLSPYSAGEYTLISLIGKMIYFAGMLSSQFISPLISQYEGKRANSSHILIGILSATTFLSLIGFVLFGLFSPTTIPFLFGKRAEQILTYLPLFTFGMLCFTISRVFVSYYQTKRVYLVPIVSFIIICIQPVLILIFHQSIKSFVNNMVIIGTLHLIAMIILHQKLRKTDKFTNFS